MLRRSLLLLLALPSLLLAGGCASGVAHTRVIDPTVVAKVSGLEKLGELTSLSHGAGGTLYVAGQTGLAAVSAQGQTLWALELPAATFRYVEGDASGAAFSAYDLLNVERAAGLTSFIMGNTGDTPEYTNQKIGAVGADGKLLWSVDAGGKAPASRPGLSADQVVVSRGTLLDGYARATGGKAFSAHISGADAFESQQLQASFNQPVFVNGAWYAAHLNHFTKTLPDGKVENDSIKDGLFSPFMNVTSNLVAVGDEVVFGNSPWDGKKARLFCAEKSGSIDWNSFVDDKETGVSALALTSTQLIAATNFRVAAYSLKGKEKWTKVNGKGGLYPGRSRGVRYIGNAFASTFAIRRSQTQQMVADEKNVYVTSRLSKQDVVTVLDAATGAYVATLDIKASIAELALTGAGLAVATDGGLMVVALQ